MPFFYSTGETSTERRHNQTRKPPHAIFGNTLKIKKKIALRLMPKVK